MCRQIALHCQTYLNQKNPTSEAIVADVRDYDAVGISTVQYPLLCVYRTGSRPPRLRRCSLQLAYFLPPSFIERDQLSGIMRFVELFLLDALTDFNNSSDCVQIETTDVTSRYVISQLGNNFFPALILSAEITEGGYIL